MFGICEIAIRVAGEGIRLEPAIGKPARKDFPQECAPTPLIATAAALQFDGQVALGREVEINRLVDVVLPVRRDLKNRWPAEAAMGEKHVFAERLFCCAFRGASVSNDFGRDSREVAPTLAVFFAEDKRNQRRARWLDIQFELPRQ